MRNLIWGFILVTIGILLLFDNLGIADFGEVLHDYWPLLLVLWGIGILAKRNSRRETVPQSPAPPPSPPPPPAAEIPSAAPPQPQVPPSPVPPAGPSGPADLVHDSNVFGDLHVQVTSQNFKGGSVSTVFGNSIIDLSNASIAEGDHELRVHTVFGNLTVILRQGMAASVAANTFFGDIVCFGQTRSGMSPDILTATTSFSTATNRLKITVHAVFGSIRVS